MKMSIIVLCMVFPLVVLSQQSEKRVVGAFKAIKVSNGIDVYLKPGTGVSVRVEATGIPLSSILTEVGGSTLRISVGENNFKNFQAKVYVTYVDLERITSSSAANIFSDGIIKCGNLDLDASTAGSIELSIESENVNVEVSTAGQVVLEGKSAKLSANASTSGKIDAYQLETEIVKVEVHTAGSARVNVTKEIEAEATTAGSIRFRGNPARSNISSNSAGVVKKVN